MLTVACLNVGNYCGMGWRYVNNLLTAVHRNLTVPHRFVCFTDCTDELARGVELRPLPLSQPNGPKGFYHKLSLFKDGVFAAGERVLYLDLDTLVTGSLDEIASYDGELAMLEDLMFPNLRASGVMAWRGGGLSHIWDSYVAAGYPDVRFDGYTHGGDGAWIMDKVPGADVLQDLYPGQIASYKVSGGVLAPQTRICCFHGVPRPHEVTEGWVPRMWNGGN